MAKEASQACFIVGFGEKLLIGEASVSSAEQASDIKPSKSSERGAGQFTFIDINVRSKRLKFRIPKSIEDRETDLPHIIYENGQHLPHPQFAAEILGNIIS